MENTVIKYRNHSYEGEYNRAIVHSGEIAGFDGWGVGGGIQYELPMPVDWFVELGLLEEMIM